MEERFKESWGSKIKHRVAQASGEIAERAGDITFADTGGAG